MEFTDLYNKSDRQILKDAEDSLNPRIDRVQEIIEYAKHSGFNKIGIAIAPLLTRKLIY